MSVASIDESPRPGWPEVLAATTGFGASYALVTVVLTHIDNDAVVALVGLLASAAVGLAAAATAGSVRIRELNALGVAHPGVRHLHTGTLIGAVIFLFGVVGALAWTALAGDPRVSAFHAAATGGWTALAVAITIGAALSSLGGDLPLLGDGAENSLLMRRPAWSLVIPGAAVLTVALRVPPVYPAAFVVGVLTALFSRWSLSMMTRHPFALLRGVRRILSPWQVGYREHMQNGIRADDADRSSMMQ